jgi:hypothetical protein
MTTANIHITWPSGDDLERETIAYLELLPPENRANLKYRAQEGLLASWLWVASELEGDELVARTCLVGAAAPLDLLNGPAEDALMRVVPKEWKHTGYNGRTALDHQAIPASQAYEGYVNKATGTWLDAHDIPYEADSFDNHIYLDEPEDEAQRDLGNRAAIGQAQTHILTAIATFETVHGPIPDPVLPATLTT